MKNQFIIQKRNYIKKQTLYLVSMPIGNLDDISKRGWNILQTVPIIIVEEYRKGKKILDQLEIDCNKKKILELNEHIEKPGKLFRGYPKHLEGNTSDQAWTYLINEILNAPSCALISDGGAPVLADPGFRLIEEVRRQGFSITHVAGACSLISGLLLSGFSLHRFYYVGFLPQNRTTREVATKKLLSIKELLVIMETPYRLGSLLETLGKFFSKRTSVSIAFSLSSKDEEIFRGSLEDAKSKFLTVGKNHRPFVFFLNNRNKL